MQALMYATQLLTTLPALISAGQNVSALITQGNDALAKMQAEKRDPSPDEWAALNASIASLRQQLHSA